MAHNVRLCMMYSGMTPFSSKTTLTFISRNICSFWIFRFSSLWQGPVTHIITLYFSTSLHEWIFRVIRVLHNPILSYLWINVIVYGFLTSHHWFYVFLNGSISSENHFIFPFHFNILDSWVSIIIVLDQEE